MQAALGFTMRDVITGFSGVVVGRVEYISGCNQALLAPKVKDDGALVSSEWFDEQRLELDDSKRRVELDNGATPGFDRAPPRR